MEITLDKHAANQGTIKITLTEADYQTKVDAKLKDYAKRASIKGFRPGKAPLGIVKSIYGTSLLVDEINAILGESLNTYLKEQPFKILGDPLPIEKKETEIDWKNQKDFDFEYKIGFIEKFDLPLDASIKASKYSIAIDDEKVAETIQNLRNQYGNNSNPETVTEGDRVLGDLSSEQGEKSESLSLHLDKITKKLAGSFIGKSTGEAVSFDAKDIKKSQWEDALGLDQDAADKFQGSLTFTIISISRIEEAALDQEFFDKIFGPDQVSTEEEFTAKVKEALTGNYNQEAQAFADDELKNILIEKAGLDIPDAFLKEWLLKANEGKISEDVVEKEFPAYRQQLVWSLISNELAQANDIKAEHEEVLAKTKAMIREQFAASGLGAGMEDSMDLFVDNYLKGEEGQNYMNMLTSVQNEKILAYALEKITVEEKNLSIDEFMELLKK